MILPISTIIVIIAVFLVINEILVTSRRKRRLESFVSKNQPIAPIKSSGIFIGFAKEQRKELEQKLLDAGYYGKNIARYYIPTKIAVSVVVGILLAVFLDTSLINRLVAMFAAGVIVIILPDILLDVRKRYMVRKISKNLPYLLDMMSVCVQTGMTIEASLAYLHGELSTFDKDLCYQVKKTSDSSKIHGIEKALNDLSKRLPAPEIQSFVLTIIQNLHYGTSVANILSDLAEDMRRIQLLKVEEKVGKLAAKMSVPLILLIMFPIVILILAPAVMQVNYNVG